MNVNDKKIRILFISHYSDMYGANQSLLGLMTDLKKRYDIIPTLLIPSSGLLQAYAEKNGIEVFIVGCSLGWTCNADNKNKIKDILKYCIVRMIVPFCLPNKDFDLIYCNSSVSDIGYYLARLYNKPLIWHLREYGNIDYDLDYILPIKKVKERFELADKLIAISKSIYDHYLNIAPNGKFSIVPNGIKVSEYHREFEKKDLFNFCVVGLISQNKNQMVVLKAASLLLAKHYNNFRINFIGEGDKDYLDELSDYIEKNNLQDNVFLYGYRSNVEEILQSQDVGIMPSLNEAFGRVTVEYMMASMPVIGTNTGGTPEIIVDGITGFIIPPNDEFCLSDKMAKYIDSHELIKEHGMSGRQRAIDLFSLQQNTDSIYKIIKDVVC